MTARKKPQPAPKTYEEWIETFEDLIRKAEGFVEEDPGLDPEMLTIVRRMRRALDVLKAPLPTPGEQG